MERRPWSMEETALLRSMYPHCHTHDVAAWLGRRISQVYNAAFTHGLRKTAGYLASVASGRRQGIGQSPNSIAARFKPGMVPWNKGRKGANGYSATRFQRGRHPSEAYNYQPIGAHRLSKEGYVERKVTDDQSVPAARRWVGVHRIVWQAAHGPIPPGYVVTFKPGCHTSDPDAITEDRLQCVPRSTLMRRNSYHTNYPPEVARLIQLRGALNRKINKHAA